MNRFPALLERKTDIIMSGMTITQARPGPDHLQSTLPQKRTHDRLQRPECFGIHLFEEDH